MDVNEESKFFGIFKKKNLGGGGSGRVWGGGGSGWGVRMDVNEILKSKIQKKKKELGGGGRVVGGESGTGGGGGSGVDRLVGGGQGGCE